METEYKECETCKDPFKINPQFATNRQCKSCYLKLREIPQGAVPAVKNDGDSHSRLIVKQVCLKASVEMLPKRTSPEKVMEYTNKLMELFYQKL